MKKNIAVLLLIGFLVCMSAITFANELMKTTVNYENDYYTFTLNNDLQTLDYSLRGYYVYMPTMLIGTNVSKYWAAAGPSGAVVVYKVEPNNFPYVLINYRTGKIEQTGYLYVDKYDVGDVKVMPTKEGAKVTVYYKTGGDKSFDLKFMDETIHI